MKWNFRFAAFLMIAIIAGAGCSVLPGLKVLSGQDTGDAAQNRLVETTELVMANKAGTTDPVLNSVADRIETASGSTIDIIEIRNDLNNHEFQVYALMLPDPNLSQLDSLNQLRRAIELTWRGIMQQSLGDETLKVAYTWGLLLGSITTLDGLPFSKDPIALTKTNGLINAPDGWLADPKVPSYIYEQESDFGKDAPEGYRLSVAEIPLADIKLTDTATVADIIDLIVANLAITEPITREEFIVLGQPATTIRAVLPNGQYLVSMQTIINGVVLQVAVLAPDEDKITTIEPTFIQILQSIRPATPS